MYRLNVHRILVGFAFALLFAHASVAEQNRFTSKAVFTKYKTAIVKVIAGNSGGTGFIVSDNTAITANHIVNPLGTSAYATGIQVVLTDGRVISVEPVLAAPSEASQIQDYAILRSKESLKVIPLHLGSWQDVVEGDDLTTIGYPLNIGPSLLTLTVAARLPSSIGVNYIVFQGPNNKGLSGAPLISNKTGEVVGIVSTKFVGISPKLEETRVAARGQPGVTMRVRTAGINPVEAIVELTNILDNFLISGMGGGIAIDYAKTSAASFGVK